MTVALALLALILPSLILIAWQLERRERIQDHRDSLAAYERERIAWADERRELLNRIKPETAQYVAPRQTVETPPVRHDDDAAYWQATMGMSREELADAVDAQERQMVTATAVPEGA